MQETIGKTKMAWQKDELAFDKHEAHVAAFVSHGRLHSPLSKIGLWILIVAFGILLMIPAVVQGIAEYKAQSEFTVMQLWVDWWKTPEARAQKIRDKMQQLKASLNNSEADQEGILLELRQLAIAENRYLERDTLSPSWQVWRELLQNPTTEKITAMQNSSELNVQAKDQIWRWLESTTKYSLFSGTYLRKWEKALEANSPIAKTTRHALQQIRFILLGDMGAKGIYGTNGWTFYRPGLDYSLRPWVTDWRSQHVEANEKAFTENPLQIIVEFKQQLSAKGIDLLVVVVPNKESIYPDYLTRWASLEDAGNVSHGPMAVDSLRKLGVDVVDLFTPFAEERHKRHPHELYLHDDTHWTPAGLQIAARQVALRVGQYAWSLQLPVQNYSEKSEKVMREGDIRSMSEIVGNAQEVQASVVSAVTLDSLGQVISQQPYKDDFRKSQILILGDSFSRIYQTDAPRNAGWIAHLAKELQTPMASIVSDGGASTLVREKLARKSKVLKGKKLVIWEFVERDFRYGENGWKSVAF